jgi:putative endonuclease
MQNYNFEIGRKGENLVFEEYKKLGFDLIVKNFEYRMLNQVGRLGEIDLVLLSKTKKLVVMVEVKTRSNENFGQIVEQISKQKLKTLYNSYQFFLQKYPLYNSYFCRFDLATVKFPKKTIEIIENAYNFE